MDKNLNTFKYTVDLFFLINPIHILYMQLLVKTWEWWI